jgi:hypothetical protein
MPRVMKADIPDIDKQVLCQVLAASYGLQDTGLVLARSYPPSSRQRSRPSAR